MAALQDEIIARRWSLGIGARRKAEESRAPM
jgi:hypothetical protein